MPLRTVALIGAVCITIGWLLAATLTPPVARVQSRPDRQQDLQRPELPAFTEQLQTRLRQVPEPPASRRNPFTFESGDRRASRGAMRQPASADVSASAPAPAVAERPAYSLAGIGISGEERTAVLTDGHHVQIVRLDDVLSGYTVVDISDDSVTLAAVGGERHVLRLR